MLCKGVCISNVAADELACAGLWKKC